MSLTFLRDKDFLRAALALAVPVAFQQLITAMLNMIDVLMVSQLGDAAVAALGLANQIFFLLILFLFGTTSGMAIFTAQYWGKGDMENIHKVLGICLVISVSAAAIFSVAATFAPETLMGFYTNDPEVIRRVLERRSSGCGPHLRNTPLCRLSRSLDELEALLEAWGSR